MTTLQKYAYAAVLIIFAVVIAFYTGTRKGHRDEKLAINAGQLKKSDSTVKTSAAKVDSAKVKVAALETTRGVVRTQIRVVHDTVTVDSSHVYVDPTLARLIQSDDSLIAAQKHALALQDTLISSLRVGITLRNTRVSLLESRGTSRLSHGVQVGLGYCQTATSRTVCGYVGYGIQIRLP